MLKFLSKYVKKYWKPFISAVIFLMLEAMCDLMQPTIMSKIVDVGVAEKNIKYVAHMGLIMLIITGFGAFAASMRNIISCHVSQNFGAELRSDMYKKIQSFSFDNIDNFESASLITRLTNDVTQVQNFINGLMRIFVKAPLLCIGSIIMAVRLNASMALVFLIIIPIISFLIYLNMKIGFPFFTKVQRALDHINSVMREYLSGVRVVKAFNRFNYETERFENANNQLGSETIKAMRVMSVFSPGISLTVNLGIASVLWFGGYKVSSHSMHVGEIIAFTNYMTQILSSMMMIANVLNMFVRARASSERINEVFIQKNRMVFNNVSNKHAEEKGSLELNNIFYSYSNSAGEPVLKNITFSVKSGETVGIIGPTGSGKSTLISLIPRFYDAASGTIKLDGQDIKDYSLKDLRNKIAVVPQKSVLFTGTVIENIKWGKEDATMDEIIESTKTAQAHEFITNLPEGYDTLLGQGGVNFSGGQKQRVSIARALVKKPEILIMDDSTSAVDVTTEAKIREGLKKYAENLTCLIIAQRITSVMTADKIIVLDNGAIVGMGKHRELLNSCDIYKDIYMSQIGKEGL